MPDRDLRQMRVKNLLAQDPEINDTQLKEFRMQLDRLLESCEERSKRTRRRILIALAVYLAAMVICWSFRILVGNAAAPNATAGLAMGLIYLPFLIAGLAAALIGIWLVALYVFKYAPQLSRARFDVQTSMMLELQQQVKQLHENMERRDK
jgi:TRAP-type C4-dicarboxylate transport system permease small subunit